MNRVSGKTSQPSTPRTKPSIPASASFLLEIGSEELPWHMIQPVMTQLAQSLEALFIECHLTHETMHSFGTPRRLAVLVEGLATHQASVHQEVFGPSKAVAFDAQGRPTTAAEGFAKSQGIDAQSLEIRETPKGLYVCVVKQQKGRHTAVVLSERLPSLIQHLSFPKTMRWNALGGRYPRPIRWILALLGNNTIHFAVAGVHSGSRTWGHRFLSGTKSSRMAASGITVKRPEAYEATLKRAGVVADPLQRRAIIQNHIQQIAKSIKGHVYQATYDELLEQAVFSVECPNVVYGAFDKKYLQLPPAVLIASMKEHQGFFSLVDSQDALLPRFLAPTNMELPKMDLITGGNERVLAARLADAQYFFEEDGKGRLADRVHQLTGVIFHKKLGTLHHKTERIMALMATMVDSSGFMACQEDCQRAALLSKADLTTEMVGEFPTLQGIMGKEYAAHDGESSAVCQALGESYQPRTPEETIPASGVGQLLAVADRLDTLAAFFHVGLVPSGSEDPFALRRQAFGLVRIVVEGVVDVNMIDLLRQAEQLLEKQGVPSVQSTNGELGNNSREPLATLVEFLADRLRYYGRIHHRCREDVMDAVLKGRTGGTFSITDLFSRMKALQAVTYQEDFDPLLAGFKRAHQLVKKEQWTIRDVKPELLIHQSEYALMQVMTMAQETVARSMAAMDYPKVLHKLIELKIPIDAFFDGVLVNAPEPALRANRLSLLRQVDELFSGIGDLSYIHAQSQ